MSDDSRPGGEQPGEFVPETSTIVIMLALFVLIGVASLFTIMSKPGLTPLEESGRRAYGPADFATTIDWKASEHLQILAHADPGAEGTYFPVPPPPLSKKIFPCTECHDPEEVVDMEHRDLGRPHKGFNVNHGPPERWCFDCHNPADRDRLRLANGELIGFDESYRLCGQCHGTHYRDWREGIHGRRVGYWDGPKTYLLCVECHNPHAPKFQPLKPLPPPIRPRYLADFMTESKD